MSFKRLFLNFFEMMGKCPATIITDEQLTIKMALSELRREHRYLGYHTLDSFHLLRNIKKSIGVKNRELLNIFSSMIKSKTEDEYENGLRKLLDSDVRQEVIQKFDEQS